MIKQVVVWDWRSSDARAEQENSCNKRAGSHRMMSACPFVLVPEVPAGEYIFVFLKGMVILLSFCSYVLMLPGSLHSLRKSSWRRSLRLLRLYRRCFLSYLLDAIEMKDI